MTASIIRVSRGNKWGTAFAVAAGGETIFYTAAHVLTDIGFSPSASGGTADLCDNQNEFLTGPKSYSLSIRHWDLGCDIVTFDCSFPAIPFGRASSIPGEGKYVDVHGYLFLPGMQIPECGVHQTLSGIVASAGMLSACRNVRLSLNLKTAEPELHGMSGSPVTVFDGDRAVVAAVFNGAPNEEGGPPFVATGI